MTQNELGLVATNELIGELLKRGDCVVVLIVPLGSTAPPEFMVKGTPIMVAGALSLAQHIICQGATCTAQPPPGAEPWPPTS